MQISVGPLTDTQDFSESAVWEVGTGKRLRFLPLKAVRSLAFSLDDKSVITCGDGKIRSWRLDTGDETPMLGQERTGYCMALSVDHKWLATSEGSLVRVFEFATGQEKAVLRGHSQSVDSSYFSKDGKYIATGSNDNSVRIWEVETGKEIQAFACEGEVASVIFSHDGKSVFAGDKGTVRMWDLATGKELRKFQMGANIYIPCLAVSADDKVVYACGGNAVTLWQTETAREIRTIRDTSTQLMLSMALSSDGKLLATGGWRECSARIWDAETGKELQVFK